MRTYGALFRQRRVTPLLCSNIVGRLPEGMGPLVVALFLRAQGFEYGAVGVLAALYGIAAAVGTPVLGRCVDLYGQVRVLAVAALGSTAGFLSLAGTSGDEVLRAGVSIVLAGLCTPPLEPCLRSLWPDVLPRRLVQTAYALDATLQELVFITGPLAVVLAVQWSGPVGGLVATGALGLLGTAVFLTSPPVRRWRAEPREADWAGPLRSAKLRTVLLSLLFAGGTIGILNISVIAYAEARGAAALSGIVLGLNAGGALIGGLVYGSRSRPGSAERQLRVLMLALAAGYVPLAFAPSPVLLVPFAVLAGVPLAPALAAAFVLVGRSAPAGTSTEAFAWVVTIFMTGNALGSTAAGFLLEHGGPAAAFAAMPVCGLLGFGVRVFADRREGAVESGEPAA